jgi:protocatechuate 3,4-dioxygenase beta subunit
MTPSSPLASHRPRPRRAARRTILRAGLALSPILLGGWVAWSRRTGRAATLAAARTQIGSVQTPACVVTPQLTEGPYFVDERLFRSDIRSDPSTGIVKEGVPLRLVFQVLDMTDGACTPLRGAVVDVWHCDALGVYSDVVDPGFNTKGQQWLRGAQYTDDNGTAEFLTIYPGWYQGRAVHIHFKVRTDPGATVGYEFTSQLFFDEAVTDLVHAQQPYAAKGRRTLLNEDDGIYRQSGGQTLVVPTAEDDGYRVSFAVGVDRSAPAAPPGGGPGGPGSPPPGAPRQPPGTR